MKRISKVLFFCLLAVISTQTFAQKFGIQAGVNMANMSMKDDEFDYSDEYNFKSLLGFNAGVTFELGFGDLIALEMGLLADTKGVKYDFEDNKGTVSLIYADIPVLLKVGPSLGPVKIFGAVGPYVGVGLTGKDKWEYEDESGTDDVKWGSGDEETKRLDYGAKFGAGAEVAGFVFGAYYSLGLANISNHSDDGYKEQTRVFSISVGYKFGK